MPSAMGVLQKLATPVSCFNAGHFKNQFISNTTVVAHHYLSEQKDSLTSNIHSPWNIKNIINKSKKNHKAD
jgi:hypothetical protein